MKPSSLTLAAAALALAGSAAFADTTVNRTVHVGPNGEVTHVVKKTVNPDGSTRTVLRTRRVSTVTTPVVVHRQVVVRHSPEWYRHHRHVAYVTPHHRRDHVSLRNSRHDNYAHNN